MGEVIFLSSSWKPNIDLDHIGFEFWGDEKIDPEIHLFTKRSSFLLKVWRK
jgi:hypothetical protein